MISKNILGLTFLSVFSIALLGCEKSTAPSEVSAQSASAAASQVEQNIAASESSATAVASVAAPVPVVSAQAQEIICDKVKINQWIGFDESAKDAQCKKVESYNIAEYRCAVEKKAFGADFDAIHLLSQNQSIFIYPSMEKCNQAKEIWQSNSPE